MKKTTVIDTWCHLTWGTQPVISAKISLLTQVGLGVAISVGCVRAGSFECRRESCQTMHVPCV